MRTTSSRTGSGSAATSPRYPKSGRAGPGIPGGLLAGVGVAAGRLFAAYLVGYGAGRFWIEGLRIDPAHTAGLMRLNQWVALAAWLTGLVYLLAARGRKWDEPCPERAHNTTTGGHLTARETIDRDPHERHFRT